MVKDHISNNPQATGAIPACQEDASHQEIASHIQNVLQSKSALMA